MTVQESFNRIFNEIRILKPQLAWTFSEYVKVASAAGQMHDGFAEELKKLTLAGEFLYITPAVLQYSLARRETGVLASLLYDLRREPGIYPFIAFYLKLSFPLADISDYIRQVVRNFSGNKTVLKEIFGFLFKYNRRSRIVFLLEQFGLISQYAPGIIQDVFLNLKHPVLQTDWNKTELWLARGTDLLTSTRLEEGGKFLCLANRESRKILGLNNVVLEDIKEVLNIYCSSIAGRSMSILCTDISNIKLKHPYTDGCSIFLPGEVNYFTHPTLNERAMTALAAHQAAAIRFGTFSFSFEHLSFKTELRQKYGTALPDIMKFVHKQYARKAERVRELRTGEVEVTFPGRRVIRLLETPHELFFYSFPTPDFAREIFCMVEGRRLEYLLGQRYTGLREDFKYINTLLWKRRPSIIFPEHDLGGQLEGIIETFRQLILLGRVKNRPGSEKWDRHCGVILDLLNGITLPGASVDVSARVTFDIYNLIFESYSLISFCDNTNMEELFGEERKYEFYPEIVGDMSPDLVPEKIEDTLFDDFGDDEKRNVDLSSFGFKARKAEELKGEIRSGAVKIYRYPEYDIRNGNYLLKHCTLYEKVLKSGENEVYTRILEQHEKIFKRIKKRFLYLQPEEVEVSRKWYLGDEIHLGDAVDYATDLRRGQSADDKIYTRKVMNVRDIAAALLVDASSSTGESVSGLKIIEIEKAALCLLSSALHLIGDTFGIFTFFSQGRHKVMFNVVKDFREAWNPVTRGRVDSITAFASNRDGCAIRHTTARLAELPHKTKLLFLLSDGIPADSDYGAGSAAETSLHAIEDTRRAIIEAKQMGIIPYCITIDKQAREYIPRLYGGRNYTVIDSVSKLPEKLSGLYLRLTK